MTLESMSLCTMRLHLEIGYTFKESSVVGSLLKYRVIVNSPQMLCGMINSPSFSSLSYSIRVNFGYFSSSYRAYLQTRRNSALPNALRNLVDASSLFNSTELLIKDGDSEQSRRLGTTGLSEKQSSSIGASGVMFTAAYDMERGLSLFASLSYKTRDY